MDNTPQELPNFDDEFKILAPIWSSVWDAAEYGCESARLYFFEVLEAEHIDKSLAPEIQRYHAKNRLKARGISNAEFMPYDVARNGIAFGFKNRHVKMWKRGSNLIPQAGKSRAKQAFLGQHQAFLPLEGLTFVVQPNRYILYETDSEFHLKWLWFGMPLSAVLDGPTEVYWSGKITFDMIDDLDVEPLVEEDVTEHDNLPLVQRDDQEEQESEGGEQGVGS